MRMLHTKELQNGSFEIKVFNGYQIPPYAIISHTWEDEELTLQDMEDNALRAKSKKGFEKVYKLCSLARADGIEYAWIDTCCIDKTSSEEITEAINSMYVWYEQAQVCYAYLADVPSKHQFEDSKWFSRGWTLQELIAPANLKFLDETWSPLGSKKDLQQRVSDCTRIPVDILSGETSLESYSVAQRMSWAAKRETTRIEDIAYSLLGLFHIHMPVIYGEGEIAFIRLQEEILRLYEDHTLFAWRHTDNRGGLLATCPAAFADSANIIQTEFESTDTPPTISSRGIHLELPFIGAGRQGLGIVILHCGEIDNPHRRMGIYVKDLLFSMKLFGRVNHDSLPQFDSSDIETGVGRENQIYPVMRICVLAGRLVRYDKKQLGRLSMDYHDQIYSLDELSQMLDVERSSILGWAAEAGNIEKLWLILSRKDPEIDAKDNLGRTALMCAAEKGQYDAVQFLLDRGAEVNADNQTGHTPLIKAIQGAHVDIVKLLISRGAEVNADDQSGQTPLIQAIRGPNINNSRLPLSRGAGVVAGNRFGQIRPAIQSPRIEIVKLLIARGADVNIEDSHGLTPLLWAITTRDLSLIETLIEYGAAIEKRDGYGHTPVFRASIEGNANVVELLLTCGAALDVKDKFHRTPLMYAARSGNYDVVKLLLDRGASVERHDLNGSSSMTYASSNKHQEVSRLLSERLAQIKGRENLDRSSSWPAKLAQRTISKLR